MATDDRARDAARSPEDRTKRARRLLGLDAELHQEVTYAERERMDAKRRARMHRRKIEIELDVDDWAALDRSTVPLGKLIACAVLRDATLRESGVGRG